MTWRGRVRFEVPNTPIDKEIVYDLLAELGVKPEDCEERLVVLAKEPLIVPPWWSDLEHRAKLRTKVITDIWYDTTRIRKHSTVPAGSTSLEYWSKEQNGFLCVFDSATVDLWVWNEDVEKA